MARAHGCGAVKVAAIILAAGGSSRMGRPKQLLRAGSRTLLGRAIDAANGSAACKTIVVTGANAELVRTELADVDVECVVNADWQHGPGTSVRAGIERASAPDGETDAAVLMVCDQPLVTSATIDSLIETFKTSGKPIVASFYGDTPGVPALFSRTLFPDLLRLDDATGAKPLILSDPSRVVHVQFPEGGIDLDTAGDYESFQRSLLNYPFAPRERATGRRKSGFYERT